MRLYLLRNADHRSDSILLVTALLQDLQDIDLKLFERSPNFLSYTRLQPHSYLM